MRRSLSSWAKRTVFSKQWTEAPEGRAVRVVAALRTPHSRLASVDADPAAPRGRVVDTLTPAVRRTLPRLLVLTPRDEKHECEKRALHGGRCVSQPRALARRPRRPSAAAALNRRNQRCATCTPVRRADCNQARSWVEVASYEELRSERFGAKRRALDVVEGFARHGIRVRPVVGGNFGSRSQKDS